MASVDGTRAVVVDNGSGWIKAGLAGDPHPNIVFPTLVGTKSTSVSYLVGDETKNDDGLTLSRPIQRGTVGSESWDQMEAIWSLVIKSKLAIDPIERPVFLTEGVSNDKHSREKAAEIMFEKFNVPHLAFGLQSTMSLFSQGCATGIVLESGDAVTQVVNVYEGYSLLHADFKVDIGGQDVTEKLKQLLAEKGYVVGDEVSRDIKEKHARIALDFDAESKAPFEEISYELPDGTKIALGKELLHAPEIIFQEDDNSPASLFHRCIMRNDVELRMDLYNGMYISGGNTMIQGFDKRVEKELIKLSPKPLRIRVRSMQHWKYQAWIGASITAASLPFESANYSRRWFSKEEYEENGIIGLHKAYVP
jgi:actin